MTDSSVLKDKVKSSPLKIGYIASSCGLSRSGFSNKLNGRQQFNQSEIVTLCNLLSLTSKERDEIFFASEVQNK